MLQGTTGKVDDLWCQTFRQRHFYPALRVVPQFNVLPRLSPNAMVHKKQHQLQLPIMVLSLFITGADVVPNRLLNASRTTLKQL